MTNYSLKPGLPEIDGGKLWMIRFQKDELEPAQHPLTLFLQGDYWGLVANETGQNIVIEEGAQLVTTTSSKYEYSVELGDETYPIRTGYIAPVDENPSSGLLNRKVAEVPEMVCGVEIPQKRMQSPMTVTEPEAFRTPLGHIRAELENQYEEGDVVTDTEFKNHVYHPAVFSERDPDDWWENKALDLLPEVNCLEKMGTTGRRWRFTGT